MLDGKPAPLSTNNAGRVDDSGRVEGRIRHLMPCVLYLDHVSLAWLLMSDISVLVDVYDPLIHDFRQVVEFDPSGTLQRF